MAAVYVFDMVINTAVYRTTTSAAAQRLCDFLHDTLPASQTYDRTRFVPREACSQADDDKMTVEILIRDKIHDEAHELCELLRHHLSDAMSSARIPQSEPTERTAALTATERTVLKYLASKATRSGTAIAQKIVDIEAGADISRRTAGPILAKLERLGYARKHSPRGGWVITSSGTLAIA